MHQLVLLLLSATRLMPTTCSVDPLAAVSLRSARAAVLSFKLAAMPPQVATVGVEPRCQTPATAAYGVQWRQAVGDIPRNVVVLVEELIDVGIRGHWLTKLAVLQCKTQCLTVDAPPATCLMLEHGRRLDSDWHSTDDQRVVGQHTCWVDSDVAVELTLRRRDDEVQRVAAVVDRGVDVLSHAEQRQQVGEAASIRIVGILRVNVEISSNDDWARLHDQDL